MQKLNPILIEYSSPLHRNGVRQQFKGQYKIDYGSYNYNSQSKQRSHSERHPLHHYRNHTEIIGSYSQSQCPLKNKCSQSCTKNCILLGRQLENKNKCCSQLDITRQQIQLPKISKSSLQNPQDQTKKKKNWYNCGNQKCPSKMHESKLQLKKPKKRENMSIKPRQLKIPSQPEIRRRYTPTFVCSRDNPLPCFKIYETVA